MEKNCTNSFLNKFSQTVNILKDSKAVSFKSKSYSYAELNAKGNNISHYLMAKKIKKGDLIAIYLDRGPELIFSILGILKCGAAYLPIDPFYPEDRIELMLNNASAKFVITSKALEESCKGGEKILIEEIFQENVEIVENPDISINPEDLAYVIYTSGSTGIPKGVMVTHGNIAHFLNGMQSVFCIHALDKFLSVSSISFDASCFDIFLSLSQGAELILTDNGTAKDGKKLFETFLENNVTIMLATPVTYQLMMHAGWNDKHSATIISAGEVLPQKLAAELLQRSSALYNVYGPTETTVICVLTQIFSADDITIGKPVRDTLVYILNGKKEKVGVGEVGEIYIGGKGVSKGYLNNASLTTERFLEDPFANDKNAKMYKSGDLGRWRKDGNMDYVGRIDNQIKLRGYRIELGEIEYRLMQNQYIRHAVVLLKDVDADNKKIVAYVVLKHQEDKDKLDSIKNALNKILPEFMVPDQFIFTTLFPIDPNGKVDRKKLLSLSDKDNVRKGLVKCPETETQKNIAFVWAAILKTEMVGIEDNFFENGGNSLLAQKLVSSLQQEYSYNLPITKVYQYPTISQLSSYLDGESAQPNKRVIKKKSDKNTDIAVIGMECNFPGATSISEFWQILKNGKETVSFFDKDEIDSTIDDSIKNDPDYIRARGILKDVDLFDAEFFNINPRIAELMDPQQRIFLEVCRNLLEKTGYLQEKESITGVYAGCGTNTYFHNNVIHHQDKISKVGYFNVASVSDKDYIGTRISYHLNLTGPSVNVNSACSTSLLAIAQAVESLRAQQCTIAIAGGVSIHVPVHVGHLYEEGAIFSVDGHSNPFDKSATGTVFSDGAGAVLLKPLADAERDGDTIYAVIKGVGISNDGGNKGSFMAPNTEGQAAAIKMALEDAEVHPSQISYIETHGTATPIGDPIEFEGLKMAFGEQAKTQYCAIGSLKSNMGHLTHAAGVGGLIKTVLALHHKQIPASINYTASNPIIDFSTSPFVVNHQLTPWNCDSERIAGVSSFGVGGTNVHVILQEYNRVTIKSTAANLPVVIKFSATNAESLELYFDKLLQYAKENAKENMEDVAFTLNHTRRDFDVRSFLVVSDMKELMVQLANNEKLLSRIRKIHNEDRKIVFMFPGQGSQYVNMGKGLYHKWPIFRNAVDECFYILNEEIGLDIRAIIFSEKETEVQKEQLKNTRYAQPAIFTICYALAKQFISWGIEPDALIGHSIGEFVAAHLAGVFSLKDVLKIIANRGKIISELPRGLMLSVRTSAENVKEILPAELSLAAVNAPELCVVSGEAKHINSFSEKLNLRDIAHNILHTSHAFHSSMMTPAVDALLQVVGSIKLSKPETPIISTVTGTWLKDDEATDPAYWATHARACVDFSKAIQTVEAAWHPLYLELGPGKTTSTLAKQHNPDIRTRGFSVLDTKNDFENEGFCALTTLGELWSTGVTMEWKKIYPQRFQLLHDIPTYAFNKKRYWIEPRQAIYQGGFLSEASPQIPNNKKIQQETIMGRENILIKKIIEIFESASGIDIARADVHCSFMELGLDSLLLTQIASSIKKEFQFPVTFRQLNEGYDSIHKLAAYLDENLSPKAFQPVEIDTVPSEEFISHQSCNNNTENASAVELIEQQLKLLAQQVSLLNGKGVSESLQPKIPKTPNVDVESIMQISAEEKNELKKPFGAAARIEKTMTGISDQQKEYLRNFIELYNKKTAASKEYTQYYRSCMADPRVVSGFKPLTKEMTYSIVVKKSAGAYLWDVDGNQYIDALNGFGSNFLGYQSAVLKKAILAQVENGYEIGPQHALAGNVCKLISELTAFDRVGLCNTGSEAVLGAMRIARSVTNKELIVAFTGSYHGINDEVLVRGTKKLQTFAAASGILNSNVQNMLIIEYGTKESLQIIKERINEIAGVLVEPVQSRRPEFVPLDFLRALRELTQANDVPLIFDEVITGFRACNGGFQEMFGIKADLATYGKVVGGGLSIGVIAGRKEYLDALDGGCWRYGDDSVPEVGVTYFAGTFVRHPLALSTSLASLQYLKQMGGKLQEDLNGKTSEFATRLNLICQKYGVPIYIVHFSSLWKIKFREEYPYSELLFSSMRFKNIHIWDGFPCFLTTAHTTQDLDKIVAAFEESIKELCDARFMPFTKKTIESFTNIIPPVPGARLGKDNEGNPAWFLQDISTGKYRLIDTE